MEFAEEAQNTVYYNEEKLNAQKVNLPPLPLHTSHGTDTNATYQHVRQLTRCANLMIRYWLNYPKSRGMKLRGEWE